MTINAAATKFSVPRKTLDDRIKGRVQHGSTPGVDTILTAEEEAGLESLSSPYGRLWFSPHLYHGQGICLGHN